MDELKCAACTDLLALVWLTATELDGTVLDHQPICRNCFDDLRLVDVLDIGDIGTDREFLR